MSTYKASLLDALKRLSSQLSTKFAQKSDLPTKVSQLSNDSGYLKKSEKITEDRIAYNTVSDASAPITSLFYEQNRANKLALLPADQVVIEQTTDGGKTWQDAGISDSTKKTLFSGFGLAGIQFPMIDGKRNELCGIRITFTAFKYNVPEGTAETEKCKYWTSDYVASSERYIKLGSIYLYISSGPEYIACTLERQNGTGAAWQTVQNASNIYGWSGPAMFTFNAFLFGGNLSQTVSNYWNFRITLMTTAKDGTFNSSYISQPQSLQIICGYGTTAWRTSNELMKTGNVYTITVNQDAIFPASVSAKVLKENNVELSNVYAKKTDLDAITKRLEVLEKGSS